MNIISMPPLKYHVANIMVQRKWEIFVKGEVSFTHLTHFTFTVAHVGRRSHCRSRQFRRRRRHWRRWGWINRGVGGGRSESEGRKAAYEQTQYDHPYRYCHCHGSRPFNTRVPHHPPEYRRREVVPVLGIRLLPMGEWCWATASFHCLPLSLAWRHRMI